MTNKDDSILDMFATEPTSTPEGAAGGVMDLFNDDPFAIFEESAWKPNEHWAHEPMTRENFAENLFEMGKKNMHEYRAALLMRFSQQVALRLGASRALTVSISDQTSYTYQKDFAELTLDYRASLVGNTQNEQLNAFIGLLVRGVGEHLLNEPDSKVREFMQKIEGEFARFNIPEIGDYAEQQAKIALTDRAISAAITEEWPGFSKYALDGLYQLQANASQEFFADVQKQLKDGKNPDGTPLSRQDKKTLELQMASQYLQASTTAPGCTFVDSSSYPWAMDIEQAGTMYRNITDLTADEEFAIKGNEIYGKVVERILDIPDTPPEAGESPDLSKLMEYHEDASSGGSAAQNAGKAKSSLENASGLGADKKVKWDSEKFQQIMDQEVQAVDENTPYAEGNPTISYFTLKAKAGPVARMRYDAIKRAYAGTIRKLRNIIEEHYTPSLIVERGLKQGRPDSARLVNTRFGKTEVFKRETPDITGEPIDVVFLIDESGSMSASTRSKGYKPVDHYIDQTAPGFSHNSHAQLAGIGADTNVRAEEGGGTRIDIARAFGVILHETLRPLTGIRAFSLGYTTGDRSDYGLPAPKGATSRWAGDSVVRILGDPKNPYPVALTMALSGNGDKEALTEAVKLLERENRGARKAIIYLADGGISDPVLESMLKNIQKEIPIFFVDMSNDVRGTGGSLKIDHVVEVNSMEEAARGIAKFFTDVVLGEKYAM